ncbi:hypothetical protein [Candidatus Magnetominusculus xianensis]|uniref:Secreted protein n=1 Tax=Candidatus Magnetominusculus xianensis TaxID=1748249 RepID=A0ABR5SK10_9BACT|nr:hypothetical protein [Candidatus Magnetominusculus xianensis]KWT92865.1 hypothetical protein ASN18_0451 [Candidatus Magnetominusculus xianensis]MBF0403454.1 hypothetical protein [Nitrospirota bacterium]
MPVDNLNNIMSELESAKVIINCRQVVIKPLNIRNRLAVFLTLSALLLFSVADLSAECEYTYYYASLDYASNYPTRRLRAFDMRVSGADIYDLPKLLSSWVYIIDNKDEYATRVTAVAKSDKDAIRFKDIANFIILKQYKDLSEDDIYIRFNFVYMTEKGVSGAKSAALIRYEASDLTIEKINKCLPKKPRRR